MQNLYGILEQIVIEVLVEMQQEMQTDFFRIHDLLDAEVDFTDFTITEAGLHNDRAVPAGEGVVRVGDRAGPSGPINNFFSLVVDVVNGCLAGQSVFMPESMEHGHVTQSETIVELVIEHEIPLPIETELGLVHYRLVVAQGSIDDVVVVEDAIFVFASIFVLEFIGDGHQHVFFWTDLP